MLAFVVAVYSSIGIWYSSITYNNVPSFHLHIDVFHLLFCVFLCEGEIANTVRCVVIFTVCNICSFTLPFIANDIKNVL